MSDSSPRHGLQPTRLLHPWDFPGKSTGVGCHYYNSTQVLIPPEDFPDDTSFNYEPLFFFLTHAFANHRICHAVSQFFINLTVSFPRQSFLSSKYLSYQSLNT